MVAECVCGPHVHLSGDSPLCPPLQLFFFYLSAGFFTPLITPSYLCHPLCSLHASVLLTVAFTCHQALRNCHTYEPHACPKHAPVSTRLCLCNQKCTNWSARTVKIVCMGSDSARVLLSCTATHCVHAKLLSLLVERCYALLSSGEGKHRVASIGYQQLPTPPPAAPAQLSAVSCVKV